ncbi:ubiquitin carboxyl-terminal hydrolase [Striga asiatica]|uniref:Ubiquitin carboxyl-terminal hydrolase n=1 Tax=Striga asiatica TaxID=4170 RepID=A0A5A7QDD0_STRAF|nr:ubiquitin carboxyl-terminal hydrolase [Striga asiatica]
MTLTEMKADGSSNPSPFTVTVPKSTPPLKTPRLAVPQFHATIAFPTTDVVVAAASQPPLLMKFNILPLSSSTLLKSLTLAFKSIRNLLAWKVFWDTLDETGRKILGLCIAGGLEDAKLARGLGPGFTG